MNHVNHAEPSANETESTGLPWPKTWKDAYVFVAASFILWLSLLIALTEFSS
jgi:hypothetical protein